MSKKQEQIVEQNAEQEEVAESEVIEAPEDITGDAPASNEQEENAEQEEVAENEVIEAPEDITGEVSASNKQEETEVKYKAKACIYYGNKKIMPGEILTGVEANTIHSLLKNGFIELA